MADEREYFERLVAVLRDHGFEWVVEQAQSEIAEGRSVTKEVRAPDTQPTYDADTLVRQAPRRRRAGLIATVPFGAAEQLQILLRAIEAAIVDRAALEEAVLKGIGDNIDVEFLPEVSEDVPGATFERRAHRLDRGRLGGAQSIRQNLTQDLMRLMVQTNAVA
jgi:hypothetical protein